MEIGEFFAFAIAGIIGGLFFDAGKIVRILFLNKLIVTAIIDFICIVLISFVMFFVHYKYLNFQVGIVSSGIFLLFFGIERISLGFLLAKFSSRLYNCGVKLSLKLKSTQLGKRIFR